MCFDMVPAPPESTRSSTSPGAVISFDHPVWLLGLQRTISHIQQAVFAPVGYTLTTRSKCPAASGSEHGVYGLRKRRHCVLPPLLHTCRQTELSWLFNDAAMRTL